MLGEGALDEKTGINSMNTKQILIFAIIILLQNGRMFIKAFRIKEWIASTIGGR